MYRHLKVVHDDPEPYMCVYKSCGQRFESSKSLREHVNSSHRWDTEERNHQWVEVRIKCSGRE